METEVKEEVQIYTPKKTKHKFFKVKNASEDFDNIAFKIVVPQQY